MQSARSRERTAWGGAQQTRGRNRQLGGSVYGAVWGCECWGCRASPVSCKPGQGRALTGYPEGETHLAAQTPLFRGFEPCNPPGVVSARLGGGRNRRVGATDSACAPCAHGVVCAGVRAVGWRGGWVGVTHRRRRVLEKGSLCSVKGKGERVVRSTVEPPVVRLI